MKHKFSHRSPIIVMVSMLCLVLVVPSAKGQLLGGDKRASTRHVPANAVASAALFPKQIAKNPQLDLFPREIVSAWGLKEIGLDPMLLREVTFVVRNLDGLGPQPPAWAAIMRLDDAQALAGNLIDQLEETTIGGKKVFSGAAVGKPSLMVFDETTIVAGDESFFANIVDANGKGPLVEVMKGSRVGGQIQSYVDLKTLRPLIEDAMSNLPPLPPQLARLRVIPKKVESIEMGVEVKGGMETLIVFNMANGEDAEEVSQILTDGVDFATEMGINMLAAQFNPDDPVQEAWLDYIDRIAENYQESLVPRVSGSQLTLQLEEEVAALPFLVGMALPAVQQTRAAARRTQSMNNVRQMCLASLNFESAYMRFPTQATYDKKGKPLLSWRVQILPFIEQQELYDQFHHDEPWDSPHNKKLIKKMPQVFMSPSAATKPGHTVYLGISGEGRMFNGEEERTFGTITDGSSNTALIVEVNQDAAVPWTKPVDYEYDEKNPMKDVGGLQPGGFIVNFADGSTHFVSSQVDPEVWKNLQTIAGGEVVDHDDY
jgi:hypothetical protein